MNSNFNLRKFLSENRLPTNIKENNEIYFGYDLDRIEDVVDYLESKYKEGHDYELHVGRGDDLPNAVTIKNPNLNKDSSLDSLLYAAQSDVEEEVDLNMEDLSEQSLMESKFKSKIKDILNS